MEAAIVILDMKEKIAIYGNVKLIVIIMVYVSTAHVFANLALVENFVIKKYVKMIAMETESVKMALAYVKKVFRAMIVEFAFVRMIAIKTVFIIYFQCVIFYF